MPSPRALPERFAPYVWARTAEDVAASRGLPLAEVLRFDANVPPLPGVPPIPLGDSFASLNEYPEGTYARLREAAAGYAGVEPDQIVVGAGADDLIGLVARTFLGPGRTAAVIPPTYPLYAIASGVEGADVVQRPLEAERLRGADVVWVCNPANPTGALVEPAALAALAGHLPEALVVVDEAYYEYAGETVVPHLERAPNLVAIRSLSKAFGFASLRVGYAVAQRELARELDRRRAPAPVSGPAARIAAAALRDPVLDVESEVAERDRMQRALAAAGYACPPSHANFVYVPVDDAATLADRLESQGLVVRRYPDAIRITPRLPAENDRLLAALGAPAEPAAARSGLVVRTTAETSLRVSLSLDGRRRSRVRTGIGFLDHLLAQLAFHGRLDLDVVAAGDLDVDEHHTVEDVLAAVGTSLRQALGSRRGLTRYGSAVVPMDEARASAAVDLVRRPHAEIALAFRGERVGGLQPTLLPHALERFAVEAGCTVHVEAAGGDDHHVAEAAFKALGRALAQACARDGAGPGSTKGQL
ncbi:MAG TPA: aminotransferase class I/II-fold pyridoxal phosphate-dependent enzyme [Gaiellaceae bacterium]|nr:aminotransferase class I/II-fold pyridoxal phosphate-dependent enzyme [Gaiellaceae bacterium]